MLFLLVFTSSFLSLLYDSGWYMREHAKNSVPLAASERFAMTEQLIDYFGHGALPTAFNQKELSHLADVKGLIDGGYIVHIVLIVMLLLLSLALFLVKGFAALVRALLWAGLGIIGFALLALLLAPHFSSLFIGFHELTFNNDLWQLDPATDKLIVLLPEQFFYDFVAAVILRMVLAAIAMVAFAAILQKRRIFSE